MIATPAANAIALLLALPRNEQNAPGSLAETPIGGPGIVSAEAPAAHSAAIAASDAARITPAGDTEKPILMAFARLRLAARNLRGRRRYSLGARPSSERERAPIGIAKAIAVRIVRLRRTRTPQAFGTPATYAREISDS